MTRFFIIYTERCDLSQFKQRARFFIDTYLNFNVFAFNIAFES